jgi:hypothetical protein
VTADSCPHCFAPIRANGRPSCACAERATAGSATGSVTSDTRAQTTDDQTTDAPPPGDQPRAVRPYLRLSGEGASMPRPRDVGRFFRGPKRGPEPGPQTGAQAGAQGGPQAGAQAAAQGGPEPGGEGNAADETQVIDRIAPITPVDRITPGGPVDRTRVIDRITAAGRSNHSREEEGDGGADSQTVGSAEGGARHRKFRRKPVATAVAGAAAVVVAGTLAFTTGLLGGNKDSGKRSDRAITDTRTSVPDEPPAEDATPSRRSSPSAKPSPSKSPSKPPSASRSQDRAVPPAPRTPSAPSTTTRPTNPPKPDKPDKPDKPRQPTKPPSGEPSKTAEPTGPPVLSEGDSGAEVTELQKRLTRLLIYIGAADGEYDDGVKNAVSSYQDRYDIKGDPDGVYGENTRRDLESRTDEP